MNQTAGPACAEHRQTDHAVRLDWGRAGAAAISDDVEVVVVVDVLSFSTTVSVDVDAGIEVVPCRWGDQCGAELAVEYDAVLAVGRRAAQGSSGPDGRISLSPESVRAAVDAGVAPGRLVLPSPNGSTIAADIDTSGAVCLARYLRHAGAVGRSISEPGSAPGAWGTPQTPTPPTPRHACG